MDTMKLATTLFPFNPKSDVIILYVTVLGSSFVVMLKVLSMSYKIIKKCGKYHAKKHSSKVPFEKLTEVKTVESREDAVHEVIAM